MECGPPRLETIQARLGQCLYLLSSSRANECWYSFGTALQLVAAVGLHRKWYAKMSRDGSTYLERELRKRIFWSAYTLDKYLSIMFGRPRLLHDEDIDQEFPDQVNDDDMSQEDPEKRTGSPDGMMVATILHFRLVCLSLLRHVTWLRTADLVVYWRKSHGSFIPSTRIIGILPSKQRPASRLSWKGGKKAHRLCSMAFEQQALFHLFVGRVKSSSLHTPMP